MTDVSPQTQKESSFVDLLDFRRQISDIYHWLRASTLPLADRCAEFRRRKDSLFAHHPQSALTGAQKARFQGLAYYPYDPAWRFELAIDKSVKPEIVKVTLSEDGLTRMQRFGKIDLMVNNAPISLSLFWILGYGGGLFLAFKDQTNGVTTYGGGRYLLDTIKHADLGQVDNRLIIDFNYAYNPSCAYNHDYHCPLPLPENQLSMAIPAGEKHLLMNGETL